MSYVKQDESGGGDTYTLRAAQAGSDVDIQLDATTGADSTVQLKAGTNITLTESSDTIAIDAAGISGITVQDEGTPLSTLATTLNFDGTGVVASGTGATKTITVSGGGGGGGGVVLTDDDVISSTQRFNTVRLCGWGAIGSGASTFSNQNQPHFRPFIAPFTGTLNEIGVECVVQDATVTTRMLVAFYDDADGAPDSQLGSTSFAMPLVSTGAVFSTGGSLNNISFTKGEQYWYAMCRNNSTNSLSVRAVSNSMTTWIGPSDSVGSGVNQQAMLRLSGSDNTLPTSVTQSNLTVTFTSAPMLTIRKI